MTPETQQMAKVLCQQKAHGEPGLSRADGVCLMAESTYEEIGCCIHLIDIHLNGFELFWSDNPTNKYSILQPEGTTQTIYSRCTLLLFCLIFLLFSVSFCFSLSKVHWFLWKQNTSSEWTELGDIPKRRQKMQFKQAFCNF